MDSTGRNDRDETCPDRAGGARGERRVYEFDLRRKRYVGAPREYRVADPSFLVADFTLLDRDRFVALERDNFEGLAARHKQAFEVELTRHGPLPKRRLADLLDLRDPAGISLPGRPGDIGLGDPFSMPYVTIESVLPVGRDRLVIVNDTNFGSRGRNPGLPDYSDIIVVSTPRPSPNTRTLAVIGDTPYGDEQEAAFPRLVADVDDDTETAEQRHLRLAEVAEREAAALAWLDRTFTEAARRRARGVVVGMQANTFAGGQGFDRINARLEALARRFERPVLLLQGDTHEYLADHPLPRAPNLTRIVVEGETASEWLRLTIDPKQRELFSWTRELLPPQVAMATYNIARAAGIDGRLDLERIATEIERGGAEVVGLQEVDRHWSARSELVDQAQWLADRLGMKVVYGANLDLESLEPGGPRRQYGTAILSDHPIVASRNTHLPRPESGEQRGLLETTIDVDGVRVVVANTHLQHDSAVERRAQTERIVELLAPARNPVVLLGDLNATPTAPELAPLWTRLVDAWPRSGSGSGNGYSYPASAPDRRIDYILTTADVDVESAAVLASPASDHLQVVAELMLPDRRRTP